MLLRPNCSRVYPAIIPRLGLAAMALVVGACASAPQRPERIATGDLRAVEQHLSERMAHAVQQGKAVGVSLAVIDDQRVVWSHSAGWADREQQRPATADTVYRMGSISKLFTVMAALQQVQDGRLDLDAPIERVLPEFAVRSRFAPAPITARLLMTHHAGLPRDQLAGMWGQRVADFRSVTAALADDELVYPPGQLLSYSNVGMSVLGHAVERAAGEPFEALLQRRLLDPLGMSTASFSQAQPATPQSATAYDRKRRREEPALRDTPAGGLNVSVNDMARFVSLIFAQGRTADGQTLLAPALVAESLRVQNAAVPLDLGFGVGLGWMLATLEPDPIVGGGPVAHHNGATAYHRAALYLLPEQRLGVVVASNSGQAGPLVSDLARTALALALEARTGQRGKAPPSRWQADPEPYTAAELEDLVGSWATVYGLAEIRRDGERLEARIGPERFRLRRGTQGWLRAELLLLGGWLPVLDDTLRAVSLQARSVAGRQVLVASMGGQEMLVAERLPAAPDALTQRLAETVTSRWRPVTAEGEFVMLERIELGQRAGWPVARPYVTIAGDGAPEWPLRALDEQRAVALGPLADSGPVLRRDAAGDGTGWRFGGYRLQQEPGR
jgi:CubicO group peptidase (beta-lactamase class C family)